MTDVSLLLPTRGRPELVRRLFDSIAATTADLSRIEVILALDEDDEASRGLGDDRFTVKSVVVPPGLEMGALNRACFEASSGRLVMLINDDIILRTAGWDRRIVELFDELGDDVALVHVNDLLFRDKLCTFPLLSRRICLEIGLCPAGYRRYRIDDHIYDTFALLGKIGHRRIFYLDDVIFEHDHQTRGENPAADVEHFRSEDQKTYRPDQTILQADEAHYVSLTEQRKSDAMRLASLIDPWGSMARQLESDVVLAQVTDTRQCRDPKFVNRIAPAAKGPAHRATVAIVTANLYSPHGAECIERVKRHSSNIDLVVLDNNGSPNFRHTIEMNKVLATANTDWVVLLDDDVFVEPGWLDALFAAADADDKIGVVVPLHKDKVGDLSFSGVYMMGDDFGIHAHHLDRPEKPRAVQAMCSAAMMVDRRKCGHLRFDETYRKHFLDLDYSFLVWEAGWKVVCTPDACVTHLGGGTLQWDTERSKRLKRLDRHTFTEKWYAGGRALALMSGPWQQDETLKLLTNTPQRIRRLADRADLLPLARLNEEIHELALTARTYPQFGPLLAATTARLARRYHFAGDHEAAEFCDELHMEWLFAGGHYEHPSDLLVGCYRGHNIIDESDIVFGVPRDYGPVPARKELMAGREGIIAAASVEEVKQAIDAQASPSSSKKNVVELKSAVGPRRTLEVASSPAGRIVLCGPRCYFLTPEEGAVDGDAFDNAGSWRWIKGRTPKEIAGYLTPSDGPIHGAEDLGPISTSEMQLSIEVGIHRLAHKGCKRIAIVADESGYPAAANAKNLPLPAGIETTTFRIGEEFADKAAKLDGFLAVSRQHVDVVWAACGELGVHLQHVEPLGRHAEFEHVRRAEKLLRTALARAVEGGASAIAIFGAGVHTKKCWRVLLEHSDAVKAFLDQSARPGQTYLGRPVQLPAMLDGIDAIVLSSDRHEDALWRQTAAARRRGVKVLRLYGKESP